MLIHFILYISLLALFVTILNSLTIRSIKIHKPITFTGTVDILVPMRNEELNVDAALSSLLNSSGLSNMNIFVLNDNSTDTTEKKIDRYKVHKINGAALPNDWLGKNFACHQLATVGTGEYLVFIDADVRLHNSAISNSIDKMNRLGWDFISPYPRQLTGSLVENLIQPLLQWSWLASVPLRLAEYFPNKAMTIANGQFFIIKRSAYLAAGGHEAIKEQVLDDLELARLLISKKFKGGVADGSKVASCRMYRNGNELIAGYTKSLWKAFGGIPGTLIALFLLVATGVLPIIYLGTSYLLIIFSRIISAMKTKSNPIYSLLHPLSILLLVFMIGKSYYGKFRGTLEWRGRVLN